MLLVKISQAGGRPLSRVAVCGPSDKVGDRENKPLGKRGGRDALHWQGRGRGYTEGRCPNSCYRGSGSLLLMGLRLQFPERKRERARDRHTDRLP